MSIHPELIRAMIAHGGDLQAAYAAAMKSTIPPQFRAGATRSGWGDENRNAAALRERMERWGRHVMPLHHAGQSVPQIVRASGLSANTVRRVIREAGHTPNVAPTRTAKSITAEQLAEADALRTEGLTWAQVGKQMGMNKDRLREAHNARGKA